MPRNNRGTFSRAADERMLLSIFDPVADMRANA
jgi:hypothetical protein